MHFPRLSHRRAVSDLRPPGLPDIVPLQLTHTARLKLYTKHSHTAITLSMQKGVMRRIRCPVFGIR